MKIQHCFIGYDENKDTVAIVHRPGDGGMLSAVDATQSFVHALKQWITAGALAQSHFCRIRQKFFDSWFGTGVVTTRVAVDNHGVKYTYSLRIQTPKVKPLKRATEIPMTDTSSRGDND